MAKRKRTRGASLDVDELSPEHGLQEQETNDYASRGILLPETAAGEAGLSRPSSRKVRRTGRLRDELADGTTTPFRAQIDSDPDVPARGRRRSKHDRDLFPGRAGNRSKVLPVDSSSDSERRTGTVRKTNETGTSHEWNGGSDADSTDGIVALPKRHRTLSHVKAAPPAYPRSAYQGWRPRMPPTFETEALDELSEASDKRNAELSEKPEYTFVQLEDFSAYRHSTDPRRPNELAGLEKLQVHKGVTDGLLFDGFLCVGSERRYVQGIPSKILTVEGYGDEGVTSLREHICVQSPKAKRRDIWYQLGEPAPEYKRFFDPFLWLAEFTKHFVDYLLEMDKVTLEDFRFCFSDWLDRRHAAKPEYQAWLRTCGLRDFRTTVCAHVSYIWNECSGVDLRLLKHPIWGEVDPVNLTAIPQRPNREQKTIVTPFAYDLFKRMYFGAFLQKREPKANELVQKVNESKRKLGLAPFGAIHSHNTAALTPQSRRSPSPVAALSIGVGDVVMLDSDPDGEWQNSSDIWYAYVQAVHTTADRTMLDILWLYEPCDTTLGKAYYPYDNELFLSDNCECGTNAIDARQVKGKVPVSWNVTDPATESGIFVRQKFRTVEEEGTHDFVSLNASDFICRCGAQVSDFEDCRVKYEIGDTVLVRTSGSARNDEHLAPAQIVDFDLLSEQVILRKLLRKTEKGCHAPPNELLLTEEVFSTSAEFVVRKCYIRVLDAADVEEGLPIGYDRGGAGDLYFISNKHYGTGYEARHRLQTSGGYTLPNIGDGPDLAAPMGKKKLTGMGIFCGGGNFDRGFEDAGCVEFKYAVDWAERALHSYRANAPVPSNVNFFLGSVNDYLAQAMGESRDSAIATPGGIDLLTAGSPCPGFSSLQPDKQSPDSLRNASLVASVVSFVDLFCPKYCILENVVNMTARMDGKQDQNVFAQVLSAFVATGYQVQQFLMDSWSHGSSQSRSRVFVVASAPGLQPFALPQLTHDNPQNSTATLRGLGMASNGKRFGMRRDEYTPFPVITAAQATADLPDIGDAQVRVCPRFPDHVMPSEESALARERIASVPISPPGMGLRQAATKGLLSGEPLEYIGKASSVRAKAGSKVYSRVYPDRLFPTVTTCLRLACGVTGRTLHWSQNRSLTVMELRRAQGFLDHEVIIGSPHQQVMIIGNSVDRKVAFALGLCLRESWLSSSASQADGTALLSPPDTEDAEESGEAEEQELPGEVKNTSEQGERDDFSGTTFPNDMLRAGTAAVANLEPGERAALQEGAITNTGVLRISAGMKVIDLTADDEDDEDE